MDDIKHIAEEYSTAFRAMDFQAFIILENALITAFNALDSIPTLPERSVASAHLQRLKDDIEGLKTLIENIGK